MVAEEYALREKTQGAWLDSRSDMKRVAQRWWDITLPVLKLMLKNPRPWQVWRTSPSPSALAFPHLLSCRWQSGCVV